MHATSGGSVPTLAGATRAGGADPGFRVLVHVDLDCFYAQVEMLRVGVPEDEPYVLLQWGSTIAVNYVARKYGINRFDPEMRNLQDMISKCPHLRYSSVPTYAAGDTEWKYHANPNKGTHKVSLDPYRAASRQIFDVLHSFENVLVEKAGIDEAFLDVTEAAQKILEGTDPNEPDFVNLSHSDAYHVAPKGKEEKDDNETGRECGGCEILKEDDNLLIVKTEHVDTPRPGAVAPRCFHSLPILMSSASRSPHDLVQPEEEDLFLEESGAVAEELPPSTDKSIFACIGTKVIPFRPNELEKMETGVVPPSPPPLTRHQLALLCAGCVVTKQVRDRVKAQLGYNVSAGLAVNKMLAKLVSAANKPNKQTLLLPSRTRDYLVDFSFRKLRGFGGKLGDKLSDAFDAKTCGDMWRVPRESFRQLFSVSHTGINGKDLSTEVEATMDGDMVYARVRGVGSVELTGRSLPKSLLAQKAFAPATTDLQDVEKWAKVLCNEITKRTVEHLSDHAQKPHGFNMKFGGRGLGSNGELLNKTVPMPWPCSEERLTSLVVRECKGMWARSAQQGTVLAKVNCLLLGAVDLRSTDDKVLSLKNHDGSFQILSKQRTLGQMFEANKSKKMQMEQDKLNLRAEQRKAKRPRDVDEIVMLNSSSDDGEDADIEVGAWVHPRGDGENDSSSDSSQQCIVLSSAGTTQEQLTAKVAIKKELSLTTAMLNRPPAGVGGSHHQQNTVVTDIQEDDDGVIIID